MTPQQERKAQIEVHESMADTWSTAAKAMRDVEAAKPARRFAKFCRRMAGNNRRAFKKNAS